jgi:hypothetical protein
MLWNSFLETKEIAKLKDAVEFEKKQWRLHIKITHFINCRSAKQSTNSGVPAPFSFIYLLAASSTSHANHGVHLFCLDPRAWSSEATSRRLQDALMYGRYEQWMARCEVFKMIFMENVAVIELNLPINMQTNLTN